MRFYLCALLISLFTFGANAQTDNVLDTIVLTGIRQAGAAGTVLNIEPVRVSVLEERAPVNLSDALSRIPGIHQLSTGPSISKPVIRGLYGNRILVLLSGLRFDNQQWQAEHGMGISYIGIDRVEVIKGPASVLFGTDALGGVINIIGEQPDTSRKKSIDGSTRFYSNTLGTLTDIGYKYSTAEKWSHIRIGVENHADYSDGRGNRVLNSRNSGYYLKAGKGAFHKNWKTDNTYNFSWNRFGFIMPDLRDFFTPDARWSRAMAGPHHVVMLNILSSQNLIQLSNSLLRINGGIQSNLRMEDEGGGHISLNMHLLSLLSHIRWEKHLSKYTLFILNNQLTFEKNTNYGARVLIPDANLFEGSVSAFISRQAKKILLEAGAGISDKYIHTFQTQTLNAPGKAIQPFAINRTAFNGIAGFSFTPVKEFMLKANLSSGFRAPNLAELSSNGLHEGIYVFEIGDPTLQIEQNINADVSAEISREKIFASVSVFGNKFFDYIYLAPTNEDSIGFPVFRFLQQDAKLYGGEIQVRYMPVKWLQVSAGYDRVDGVLKDGTHIPYIPAQKATFSIRFKKDHKVRKLKVLFAEPELVYVFAQNNPAVFETSSPAYFLLNLFTGATWETSTRKRFDIGISGLNLLDAGYADHLSRLRNYGILNPGRNIMVKLHVTI